MILIEIYYSLRRLTKANEIIVSNSRYIPKIHNEACFE